MRNVPRRPLYFAEVTRRASPADPEREQARTPVPALQLSELSKVFGGLRAVDSVGLSVAPGERRALIGPNGMGNRISS